MLTSSRVRTPEFVPMNPIQGHHLITPDDLSWRLSNLMRIPNADYLERTGSHNLGRASGGFRPGAPTRSTSTSAPRNFISS